MFTVCAFLVLDSLSSLSYREMSMSLAPQVSDRTRVPWTDLKVTEPKSSLNLRHKSFATLGK